MKKIIALLLVFVLFSSQIPLNSLISFAETESGTADSVLVGRAGTDFWSNSGAFTSGRYGLDGDNYYYNCFNRYRTVKVKNVETYYADPETASFYFTNKKAIDTTSYLQNGVLRFWISVPKDMTVRIGLMSSYSSNGKVFYGYARKSKTFSVADQIEGYQKVEIPLSEITASTSTNWNAQYTRYVTIDPVLNATAETFLAEGEVIKVSPFEIWSNTPPEVAAYDDVPVYYSTTSKAFLRDINYLLDETANLNFYKNTLDEEAAAQATKALDENFELEELYTAKAILAGADATDTVTDADDRLYKMSDLSQEIELHIPLTEPMLQHDVLVCQYKDGVMSELDFISDGEYLIVTSDLTGDIAIIDQNKENLVATFETMSWNASDKGYKASTTAITDNTETSKGVKVTITDVDVFNSKAKDPTFYQDALSAQNINVWNTTPDAEMRFWIRTPKTISASLRLVHNSGYKRINYTLKVNGSTDWQEIRIKRSQFDTGADFNALVAGGGGKVAFQMILPKNVFEKGDVITVSHIEFYDKAITAEVNNGNIERIKLVDFNGATGYDQTAMTTTQVVAFDNQCSRVVKKITPKSGYTPTTGEIKLMPYAAALTVDEGSGKNALAAWFDTDSELRTYLKNDSNNDIQLMLGVYASVGGGEYPNYKTGYITIPANSGWQEVRLRSSSMTGNDADAIEQIGSHNGNVYFYIYTKGDKFIDEVGEALYVAPVEAYNLFLLEDKKTDIGIDYERIIFNRNYNWNSSSQFDRAYASNTDTVHFAKAVSFTANSTYTDGSRRMNIIYKDPVVMDDFADWAFNPNAEMRFWVRSKKDVSFNLYIQQNNKDLSKKITLKGSDDWQEIVLKRSDFNNNSAFDSALITDIAVNDKVYIYANTISGQFAVGDKLEFGDIFEFYKGKAYDKGDANRDEAVNVKDIVRAKKLVAEQSDDIINADVNNDNKLSADDILYIRTKLLTGFYK